MKKQVLVPRNDGASVTFMVVPNTLGMVDIKVSARTSVAGDSVQRKLRVKASLKAGGSRGDVRCVLGDLGWFFVKTGDKFFFLLR